MQLEDMSIDQLQPKDLAAKPTHSHSVSTLQVHPSTYPALLYPFCWCRPYLPRTLLDM